MSFISRHAIGVLVVLVVAGWALFYVPTTPSYAVYQLKQAIDARDGATAATFVDFPSVVKNAGYEMLQQNSQANDVITALVGKGAVDLLNSGSRQLPDREKELAAHVDALRDFLESNAPATRRLVQDGVEYPAAQAAAPTADQPAPKPARPAAPVKARGKRG